MSSTPSAHAHDVRAEILAQHRGLRSVLDEVEGLARRFAESSGEDDALGRELHACGLSLYEQFGDHIDREQELLTPVLTEAGAGNERLLSRLQREHREQRALLRFLLERLRRHPQPSLLIARELENFGGFLRHEMVHEEEGLLAAHAPEKSGT